MVDVHIAHKFVTAKADSPDPTIVSASEWNAFLAFMNGNNGQVAIRNNTSPEGATWVDGPRILRPSDAYGGTAVNTPAMSSTPVTFSSNGIALILPSILVVMTAGTGCIMSVFRNGSSIGTGPILANGTWITPFATAVTEAPGTYTYDVRLSGTSGSISSAQTLMTMLIIGVL